MAPLNIPSPTPLDSRVAATVRIKIILPSITTTTHLIELEPVRLLKREALPLSWLDVFSPLFGLNKSAGSTGRNLFKSRIPALEAGSKRDSSLVLITRHEHDGRLYVIECVDAGLFAICAIGQWLQDEERAQLGVEATVKKEARDRTSRMLKRKRDSIDMQQWRKPASQGPPDETRQVKRARTSTPSSTLAGGSLPAPESQSTPLALEDSDMPLAMPLPEINEPSDAKKSMNIEPEETQHESTNEITIPNGEEPSQPPDRDQILESLVTQYLETLYLSRASLAFFAKGPLSRTRAAFTTSALGPDISLHDLTRFLRTMILSTSASEKKYKEKLPPMVEDISPMTSDEENETAKRKKPKKKKKVKLSREGMYSFEGDYVKKWWKSEHGLMSADETKQQVSRRRLNELRVRETLMQIVLLLEIMALEATPEFLAGKEDAEKIHVDAENQQKTVNTKTKKPQDISVLLDLLVDKLAIWQSVENDVGYVDLTSKIGKTCSSLGLVGDRLGSFCVEVVIPFFKPRVGKQAAMILRRLSGAPASSPNKDTQKPGSKVKQNKQISNLATSKRTSALQRVPSMPSLPSKPTDNKTRPSLARSSTDLGTVESQVKREPSEARTLASLLLEEPSKSKPRKDALAQLKRRQISLKDITVNPDLKRKRAAATESQIKEAINLIKKPRQEAFGRAAADEREQRQSSRTAAVASKRGQGKAGKSSQSKSPLVAIDATPTARRILDMSSRSKRKGPFDPSRRHHPHLPVSPPTSSSDFVDYHATARQQPHAIHSTNHAAASFSRHARAYLFSDGIVAETPSRGADKFLPLPSSSLAVPDSARKTLAGTTSVPVLNSSPPNINSSTPSKQAAVLRHPNANMNVIPGTPVRRSGAAMAGVMGKMGPPRTPCRRAELPAAVLTPRDGTGGDDVTESRSIYDVLGWNDDID